LTSNVQPKHLVAVIGAGPAGLFAARELANQGHYVVIFNRDIKPGGLAEYGIYPDKYKMKTGLRGQFHQILFMENIEYFGNVAVGEDQDLTLEDLRQLGFQALLVTVGAQGTKWLGMPGEDLQGVYHAKDLVYHYNHLPPFSEKYYEIGQRVAVIGVGNVMMDISHYLMERRRVQEVWAIARRGPGEIKFDKNEVQAVGAHMDIPQIEDEIDHWSELMRSLDEDPDKVKELLHNAVARSVPFDSPSRFRLRFLLSPRRILGDSAGRVCGLEVEHNTLFLENGNVRSRGLGTTEVLPVDTVIFAIGDRVDDHFGLPVASNEFIKAHQPRYPVEGITYEVEDPETHLPILDVFVAGWARRASTGLVGIARKDGTQGAQAVNRYLATQPLMDELPLDKVHARVRALGKFTVDKQAVLRLHNFEQEHAKRLGVEDFKFDRVEDMITAIQMAHENI